MIQQRIYISNVDNSPVINFDTGLDQRSFARTKMSQSLIEPGYAVFPDGSNQVWKSSGVNEINGFMRVWGSPFTGKRLDLIINEAVNPEKTQAAIQAVAFWIRAKLLLGETRSALSPGASLITCEGGKEFKKGSVFFAPDYLSQRCLLVEGSEPNYFTCPDLYGIDAAAFCAGTMLYKILSGSHPYPTEASVFQDMREGVFLPPGMAIPGLDEKFCSLIQSALMLPVTKKKTNVSGIDILDNLLKILMDKDGNIVSVSSLFSELSFDDTVRFYKNQKRYLKKNNFYVKTRRFVHNYKLALMVSVAVTFFLAFVIGSTVQSRALRPTTTGLYSDNVVHVYYEALNSMDHQIMEACIAGGTDKTDINMIVNLFVVDKVRQSYEYRTESTIISARAWRQQGRELPAPNVFGITDLHVEQIGGSENSGQVHYRADYQIWFPHELIGMNRSDILTLRRDRRMNWRITELIRTEF